MITKKDVEYVALRLEFTEDEKEEPKTLGDI